MVDPLFGTGEPDPPTTQQPSDQGQTEGQPLNITIHPHERQPQATAPTEPQPLFGTGAATSGAPSREAGALDNASGDDEGYRGAGKNLGATVMHGLTHVPGMAGDVIDQALRIGASLRAKMPGEDRPREQIEQEWRAGLTSSAQQRRAELEAKLTQPGLSDYDKNVIQRHIARIGANPEGTPPTGEQIYKKSIEPKLGDYTPTSGPGRFGRAIGETAIPAMLTPGMTTGKAAMSGAAAGAAGQGATELGVTDPLALAGISIAGGAVPSTVAAGTTAARRAAIGTTAGEQSTAADKIVKDYREHPETQLADTLGGVAKDAKPEDVSAAFQAHHDALMKEHEDTIPAAVPSADEAGAALQETLKAKNKAAKDTLNKFEESIDPDRKMGVWVGDLADHANERLAEARTRPEQDRSAVADDYLTRARNFDTGAGVKSFRDLVDFDRSLTGAITQAKKNDPIAYRELTILKGKVKEAQNKAVENQHKWDQGAVRNGTLTEEGTLADRLQRQRDEWLAQRAGPSGQADRASTGTTDAAGASGVSAVPAADQGGRGPGAAGEPGGVPGSQPLEPLSADAAANLKLFNQAHGLRKDTFENGPAADVAKAKLESDAAKKAFVNGPKGYEVGKAVLTAGGDEALASMKDIATGRLQAELKGKPLDQKALDAFKTKHFDALRAIDEKEPGFSNQFNNAATARQNVQNFEKSAAAKFLDKEPSDVVNHIGSLVQRGDSSALRQLIEQARATPDGEAAVAGIQRAAAQALANDFETRGPNGILQALKSRRSTLDAVFDPANVKAMADLGEKIEKTSAAQTIISRATGAPVSDRNIKLADQLKAAVGKDKAEGAHSLGGLFWLEGATHAFAGDFGGAATVLGLGTARSAFNKARERHRVKGGNNIAQLVAAGLTNPEVGKAMAQRATDAAGRPNALAYDALAKALIGTEGAEGIEQRQGHAAGGGVFDHKAAAKHMVGMVDRARKRDAVLTKPLLQAHDTTIANALALANRST